MNTKKMEKTVEIIYRLAAEFVQAVSSRASLITVTRITLSPTGKEVAVFFTTIPDTQEDTALKFLTRKLPEFKNFLKEKSRLGIIPHIEFKIDYGERNRQRLDELSRED